MIRYLSVRRRHPSICFLFNPCHRDTPESNNSEPAFIQAVRRSEEFLHQCQQLVHQAHLLSPLAAPCKVHAAFMSSFIFAPPSSHPQPWSVNTKLTKRVARTPM